MKRNLDLVRALLLKLESFPTKMGVRYAFEGNDPEIAIEGYNEDEIYYHLNLLRETGLIECPGSQPALGITFAGLSWSGHDYLDVVRNPEIWRKTKEWADAVGSFSFDLIKQLAVGFIKKKIEDHTGVML